MISNNILEEIKKKLSLEAENFEILASTECSIYWDQIRKAYVIEINRNQIDYYLIHEFGHVFLSKITRYPYFIKFTSEVEKINQEIVDFFNTNFTADIEDLPKEPQEYRIIHDYSNAILDCFVNYNTFIEKIGYYKFYLNYIKEILDSGKTGIKPNKLRILLPIYINFYLEFLYNFPANDRIHYQNDIDYFLLSLKKAIANSTKFKLEQFESLNKELDKYDKIKNSTDHRIIIDFIYNVLLKLSIWDESTLKEKLAIIYPVKIKKNYYLVQLLSPLKKGKGDSYPFVRTNSQPKPKGRTSKTLQIELGVLFTDSLSL